MATRKHLSHDAKTRERIRTSQLLNRLNANAFGEIELTQGQLKSIEILLRKSLPDLQAIAFSPADEETAKALGGMGAFAWQQPQ